MSSMAHIDSSMVHPAIESRAVSRSPVWAGRLTSTLVVLFLLFDGATKVIKERHVLQATAQLGISASLIAVIGTIRLICTLLYAVPRTAFFGALLLTGYLGGAVAIELRVGNALFNQTLFPVYFGALVWLALHLRDARVRSANSGILLTLYGHNLDHF